MTLSTLFQHGRIQSEPIQVDDQHSYFNVVFPELTSLVVSAFLNRLCTCHQTFHSDDQIYQRHFLSLFRANPTAGMLCVPIMMFCLQVLLCSSSLWWGARLLFSSLIRAFQNCCERPSHFIVKMDLLLSTSTLDLTFWSKVWSECPM